MRAIDVGHLAPVQRSMSGDRGNQRQPCDSPPTPIEPLETPELSAHPSVQGRLYGDDDGSIGKRDETAARLHALGIDSPIFKSFACVLHGHDHRARIHPTKAGHWHYECEGLSHGAGLAEVRAYVAYRAERDLTSLEAARWRERLDFEAGLRCPVPVDVSLPEPCPQAARRVAGGLRLFVGLRDTRFPFGEPVVFAHDFAQAYCDLSGDKVRAGKDWLERARVIYRVGTSGRSILWKLVGQDNQLGPGQ
jgi:hypothetical protein